MRIIGLFTIGTLLFLAISCDESNLNSKDKAQVDDSISIDETVYVLGIPTHFPAPNIPKDNPLTVAKVNLGKQLFFDVALSIDSSVSCASCHLPNKAFSDKTALSRGANGRITERNSPSLMNVAFHPILMREGAVPNLELQVLSPLEGETEMAHNIVLACARLNRDKTYRKAFLVAFGDTATPFTLTRAIAAFERTLIGGNAPLDKFYNGDSTAISDEAKLGYELFSSARLGCTGCHSGVFFTDFSIQNNGLHDPYKDYGLYRVTLNESDIGKFKVPSLRNIALTAPYMHDGSLNTLEAVLTHYSNGGAGHQNQSDLIKPFKLNQKEKQALLSFFESLTENAVMQDSP